MMNSFDKAGNYVENRRSFPFRGFPMIDASGWFTEVYPQHGSAFSLKVKAKLHEEQTPFQKIEIYDTEWFGKLMIIDGCTMVSDRDNFLYHEMMTHPVLYTHPRPERVWIIGGGDCGSLKEVLRHPEVKQAVQIEIDERVTRLAEEHFPDLCTSNTDPRAELLFIDGIQWVKDAPANSVDVIIVDSTDPVGPAEGLFNRAFYQSCLKALRPGGILVQQSESPIAHLPLIRDMRRFMRAAGFDAVRTLPFPQPCYPTGWWSCTMARKGIDQLDDFRDRGAAMKKFATRYYNVDVHRAALAMPEFMREGLE
jgi:spermidine synthase